MIIAFVKKNENGLIEISEEDFRKYLEEAYHEGEESLRLNYNLDIKSPLTCYTPAKSFNSSEGDVEYCTSEMSPEH